MPDIERIETRRNKQKNDGSGFEGTREGRREAPEIEAVVGALPEVSLAAVIGRPDAKWGERPVLLVEMRDDQGLSDEALLAPLKGRVATWWIPDEVVRIPNMPLASTGKIDKIRLRSEYGHAS